MSMNRGYLLFTTRQSKGMKAAEISRTYDSHHYGDKVGQTTKRCHGVDPMERLATMGRMDRKERRRATKHTSKHNVKELKANAMQH